MKRSFLIILSYALIVLSFSTQAQESVKKTNKKAKGNAGVMMADLPYSAYYSSNFAMGKPEHAKMILELYKDYENQVFRKDDWFSDTVLVLLPDGNVMQGRDSVLNAYKQMRSGMNSTSFDFAAIIPLRSVDRNEDWVALWYNQEIVPKDASTPKANLAFQAIWRIGSDKKINFMRFFEAPQRPQ